jgi:hypothetical protein
MGCEVGLDGSGSLSCPVAGVEPSELANKLNRNSKFRSLQCRLNVFISFCGCLFTMYIFSLSFNN